MIDPDTIPDAVTSYNVDILDGTPYCLIFTLFNIIEPLLDGACNCERVSRFPNGVSVQCTYICVCLLIDIKMIFLNTCHPVSAGTQAGLAIGMLVLGAVVGVALTVVFIRRKYGLFWSGDAEDARELKTWEN